MATAPISAKGNDWILLVDTSKSIKGVGKGSKDISKVYGASIKAFVQSLQPGDRLYAHSFDEKSTFQRFIQTTDKKSVAALASEFDDANFQPRGDCTLIGDAIAAAVIQASYLKRAGRLPGIVLFTDGIETCMNRSTKRMAHFETRPVSEKDFPHGFHVVWAGRRLDEEKLRSRFPAVIRDRITILDLEKSTAVLEQARSVSPPSLKTPSPTIDFGSVYQGGKTEDRLVRITATRPAAVQFSLAGGARNGFVLRGITQPTRLKSGDNDISLSIESNRTTSPGIHDDILEVRSGEGAPTQEAAEPLLVFNVRIITSRFWFPSIWAWIVCGLLFLVSTVLLVAARTPRNDSLERDEDLEPQSVVRVTRVDKGLSLDEVAVARQAEDNKRLRVLLATKKASLNELQASLRRLKEQTDELELRCDLLEREISDLTSSLRGH